MPVSTPPRPSPSRRPGDTPTASYRRSPSVSEAIQQYESKSKGSSPSSDMEMSRTSSSGLPKARPLVDGKGTIGGTKSDTTRRVTDSKIAKASRLPQPTRPFPRSNSDTFSSPSTSISNTAAGPSRSANGTKPISPRIRPRPAPTLRRKSSRDDLFKASNPPSPASSREMSPQQPAVTLYFGEFGEREDRPTSTTLESGAIPMVRGGPNRSSRSSVVEVTGSGSSKGSPKLRVAVRERTSSKPDSPTSPKSLKATIPPPISPRTSSRRPDDSPARRTSKVVPSLGEPLVRPPSTRTTSQSSITSTTETKRSSVASSNQSTPKIGPSRPHTSPRKSPGLTIQTRPAVTVSRYASSSSIPQPSPPIPAKSPLRNLHKQSSEGRLQTHRSGSMESNAAQAGTPVSSRLGPEDMTPNEAPSAGPKNQVIATPDEIRFTQYTMPSIYSQDSAPSSATSWALNDATMSGERRGSRLDSVDWGKQSENRGSIDRHRRSSSLPRLDKALPYVPETPTTATTFGSDADATQGHTPVSPVDHREPSKSPSLPMIRGDGLLPAATLRSATDPLRPLLPSSPSIVLSKRTHLINEIATSERNYAKDLALIRDAYMYRFLRPISSHSASQDTPSDVSRRSSVYTYQTAETKRSSGYDSGAWTPLPKSPSDGFHLGYFPNGSSSSSFGTSQPSALAKHKSMGPPVGKPLSPGDIKAVFLNLDHLASAAEDLATAFEKAATDVEVSREGDGGGDQLGHAFIKMIPRLRPLYTFYCARQSQASARLVELQSDPAYSVHLTECWSSIKKHTHAWNLDSMLIKPVQRITKYPLLFGDLLACTTPVHPDYFAIRTAAQMSRAIATEIDEAKRRKDVVSSVIKISSPKEAAPSKLLGFKRFRKGKSSSVDLTPPAISDSSLNTLKDLVIRVDELDHCVRRVGKEIIMWTAAAKEALLTQDGLVKTWLRVVQLEPTDSTDRKMLEFRKVVDQVLVVWQSLNDEVRSILPAFSKLLESTGNPKKVITKRDSKYMDYSRYHALKASKKAIDKNLVSGAAEFVALHTQLVEELPPFIEGCLRILDMALVAFAKAQARYHQGVKEKLQSYIDDWLTTQPGDVSLVKAWHDQWVPYSEAMDHFQVTRPTRHAKTRVATFNAKSGSRPTSRAGSPMGPPALRHSASITAPSSRPGSPAQSEGQGRYRSSSLRSQTGPTIITTSPRESQSRFSLLRRNSKSSTKESTKNSNLRPSSVHSETSSRISWGLPRISPDQSKPMFEGLGLSPTKSSSSNLYNTLDLNSSQVSIASIESRIGLGLGDVATIKKDAQRHPFARDVDAAEGWRHEKVLYQCACVADFDPDALGNRFYRGLRFLPMISGDLVDIFHEVGRIDELPSFPYPEVGVDNDGVLVGRAEDGAIGLVICSFLEPLRG